MLCLVVAIAAPCLVVRAQVVVRQDFDGAETTWRDGRAGANYRKEVHQRVGDGTHSGPGCEYVQFMAGASGTLVYMTHDLAPARVIDELKPSLWIRSDRPGIQILARIVFPRSINPETQQPDTALVAGTSYTRVGSWEQLRIEEVPRLAAAQARVLRAEFKRDVDIREAFVDRLVLNLYTGTGRTRLWIDDLEIAGFVGEAAAPGLQLPPPAVAGGGARPNGPRGVLTSNDVSSPQPPVAPAARREGPQLSGGVLLVGGRPMFPRAIEYQGESLARLKKLGFNTVRLRTLPSSEILAAAAENGLWIICPPPMPAGLDRPGNDAAPLSEFPPEFDCVLAWDLGEGLTGQELDVVKRWAEQVRKADRLMRPILCGPSAELRAYSAPGRADVLVLDRFTPSTSFELGEYRRWLRERPRFARHGTPIWSTIPTEPAAALTNQLAAFSAGQPATSILVGTEQTRLVAYTALGAGARALIFASHAPLTGEDPDTRWRAAQLEMLNYELDLIEPWIAGGMLVTSVTSTDHEVLAAVLQTGGAHLVLPVWSGRGAQYVPGHTTATAEVSFVVPGVPETTRAYEIWPGGMRALRCERVTGGMNVRVDDFGVTSMILLTQNLLGDITRRTNVARDRATQLTLEMAQTKLAIDTATRARLEGKTKPKLLSRGDALLKAAQKELQDAQGNLATGNMTESFRHAQFAMRNLRAMERDYWSTSTAKLGSPVRSPFAVTFSTVPDHVALMTSVDGSRRMANLLPDGNFEDLGHAINAAGWKHFQHPPQGVHAGASFSPAKHCEGKHSLWLTATADDPN